MSKIIVGSGLIASAFRELNLHKEVIFFASGVSNSLEVRKEEFDREIKLIEENISRYSEKLFLYFSTYSINEGFFSPYIRHKNEAENLIRLKTKRHIIIRLPQLVGVVNNSTLISYLTRSLILNKRVQIYHNAKRNLLDIEDLVRITKLVIEDKSKVNSTVIIKSKESIDVLSIYLEIASILKKELNYDLAIQPSLKSLDMDTPPFWNTSIYHDDLLDSSHYWRSVLARYVPSIKEILKNE